MWLWLLACTPSDPEPSGDGPASSTVTGDTSAAVSTPLLTGDTAIEPAPLLAEALSCEVPGPPMEPAPVVGDLHRVTLSEVVCNDGTPAVAFVRAALDPSRAGDWVVHLDGGAFCSDGPSCAARWCGEGGYDAGDMSSAWAPLARTYGGLTSSRPSNAFAGWNQVYVPYCTSDMWMGQRRDVEVQAGEVRFRLHFDGAEVVDAVFDTLLAGARSDDGEEVLPPLGDGVQLLFAGTSAGGMGVSVHLDAVAERLAPLPVTGLVDALWSPDPAHVAEAGADDPAFAPDYIERWNAARQVLYDDVLVELYHGRLEASCGASGVDPWLCIEAGILQRDHVTTPFLLHHDLRDPVLGQLQLDAGATFRAYGIAGERDLLELVAARPDVAVIGSSCAKHTVLSSTSWFEGMLVDEGGTPLSVHDGSESLMGGLRRVAVDAPQGTGSFCP